MASPVRRFRVDLHRLLLTGLNSKSSRATIAVAALGSFCVASAMFLILELSQPYTSSMRVSSDGIDRVGLELDKP